MRWLKLIFFLFILTPTLQGADWLSFEGKGKLSPQVEFKGGGEVEIHIPGIEVREKGEMKDVYQVLRLPGELECNNYLLFLLEIERFYQINP